MMTNLLKTAIAKYKEKSAANETAAIKSDFKLCEKNGKIYLTHQGYAFAVMTNKETAENIASRLNAARNAAIEFEEE